MSPLLRLRFALPALVIYTTYMTERYTRLYDSGQVRQRIGELASQIVHDHRGNDPLFVALLRGGAPFASQLMFAIRQEDPTMHPELDYMQIGTYGNTRTAGEPRIEKDLSRDTAVFGRTVIVLDDVLDLGRTAHFVEQHLLQLDATNIELAVLASKDVTRDYPIVPQYVGFNTGDKWLVGMGMDDGQAGHEHYRWHDEILEVKQD